MTSFWGQNGLATEMTLVTVWKLLMLYFLVPPLPQHTFMQQLIKGANSVARFGINLYIPETILMWVTVHSQQNR